MEIEAALVLTKRGSDDVPVTEPNEELHVDACAPGGCCAQEPEPNTLRRALNTPMGPAR